MKFITIPADVLATNILGQAIPDEHGNVVSLKFKDFIYGRAVDPKFFEGKEGMEAAMLIFETKNQLDAEYKHGDGVLAVEDEQGKRLLAATEKPTNAYNPQVMHCLVPFMQAIKNMSDKDPRLLPRGEESTT